MAALTPTTPRHANPTPQGTPAETMMYVVASDSYQWTACQVVGWDAADRMFVVRYDSAANTGPKTKKVKRLNLRFLVRMCLEGTGCKGCAS